MSYNQSYPGLSGVLTGSEKPRRDSMLEKSDSYNRYGRPATKTNMNKLL
jgi:hypothetical protein